MAATAYRVFLKHEFDQEADPQTAYAIVGTFEASNAKQAIHQAAVKLGEDADGRTFAATPARGWSEEDVKVKVEPRVSFS